MYNGAHPGRLLSAFPRHHGFDKGPAPCTGMTCSTNARAIRSGQTSPFGGEPRCWDCHGADSFNDWRLVSGQPPQSTWCRLAIECSALPTIKPSSSSRRRSCSCRTAATWKCGGKQMYTRGYLVPNELFFVRNNSPVVPRLEPGTWRLQVSGSGVSQPRSFNYDDIVGLPSIAVIRAIECAGNGRNFFQVSHGKTIAGTPWNLGGIGVAEWTGVPLREVLDRAGVKRTARYVMPEGSDERHVKRPLPIGKALADDTLLVYAMNGHPLPPDHGFPVRLLVPGWVGIAHIKWIGRIEVSEQPLYSEYNTTRYVLIGPGYTPRPPALGPMVTTQKVKSAFELPWNGEVPSGKRLLRGRSWSGEGAIAKVDVSLDGGQTWQAARLRHPNIDTGVGSVGSRLGCSCRTLQAASPGDRRQRQRAAGPGSLERGGLFSLGRGHAPDHGKVAFAGEQDGFMTPARRVR